MKEGIIKMVVAYEIGKYFNGVPKYIGDGASVTFNEMGFNLALSHSNFKQIDLSRYLDGEFKFKAYRIDGITFMLFKFGNGYWGDAPLVVQQPDLEPLDLGDGYALTVFLLDSKDSTILGMRTISLKHRFSMQMKDYVSVATPLDLAKSQRIQNCFDTDNMVKLAQYDNR